MLLVILDTSGVKKISPIPSPDRLKTNILFDKPPFQTSKCGNHPQVFKCKGDSKGTKIIPKEVVGEYGNAAYGKILQLEK